MSALTHTIIGKYLNFVGNLLSDFFKYAKSAFTIFRLSFGCKKLLALGSATFKISCKSYDWNVSSISYFLSRGTLISKDSKISLF